MVSLISPRIFKLSITIINRAVSVCLTCKNGFSTMSIIKKKNPEYRENNVKILLGIALSTHPDLRIVKVVTEFITDNIILCYRLSAFRFCLFIYLFSI